MSFLKRLFGFYDPGDPFDDIEDDFTDPAEVKKKKGKKNDEPETIPWGPLVPAGADLLFEVPRPGQSDPDLYTVSDYREKIWKESGKSPSADIGTIIQGRIKSGDIGFRLYLLDPTSGKAVGPAPEELSNAFIELYNKLYKEALDKLAEELAKRRERSKKAAAKIAADKEAEDKAPEEVRAELVEDLVRQAKAMTFEQKRDLIAMFPSLSEAVRAKIISARPDPEPDPPAGDTGSPADPPPAGGGDGTT